MLDLNKVTGAEPVRYEKLRGGTFINVLPGVVEVDGGEIWEYWQMFTTETNEVRLGDLYTAAVKQVMDETKGKRLGKLTVTTASGKVFYADTESRVDLQSAIDGAALKGMISTYWKLAEEFEGKRIIGVSLSELREASALALEAKGSIVGVSSNNSVEGEVNG